MSNKRLKIRSFTRWMHAHGSTIDSTTQEES